MGSLQVLIMTAKITKRTIDGLAVPAGSDESTIWDAAIKGFGVRTRAGGVRTYTLHYRAGSGRGVPLRKLTIGKHGSPWMPKTAMAEAKRLLGQVVNGGDPAKERGASRTAITVVELCGLYFAEGVAHKKESS